MTFRLLHICAATLALGMFVWRYTCLPQRHVAPTPSVTQVASVSSNATDTLVRNGDFSEGLTGWTPWMDAKTYPRAVSVVGTSYSRTARALRIGNPLRGFVGVQQVVTMTSGCVYRLSGSARSTAVGTPPGIFGGRIVLFFSPQREYDILWLGEHTSWWGQAILITNVDSGPAVLAVHLGYGKVATTGEFSDVKLESVQ